MKTFCAFGKQHSCLKWIDYQLTRRELEEVDALCHRNWIEIQRPYKRIETLETMLRETESEQNRCAMACQGCGAVFAF